MDKVWLRTPSGIVLLHTLPLGEHIERQLSDGILTRVQEDGAPYPPPSPPAGGAGEDADDGDTPQPDPAEPATPPVDGPVRPAQNAPKQVWVAYVVALGLADEPTAVAMTKVELVAAATPPELTPPTPEA